MDSLEGGESVEEFLEAYPTVKREQAIAVIEADTAKLMTSILKACNRFSQISEDGSQIDPLRLFRPPGAAINGAVQPQRASRLLRRTLQASLRCSRHKASLTPA